LAFGAAQKQFGVAPLLDPTDFTSADGVDEKCVMTYVAMLMGGFGGNLQHEQLARVTSEAKRAQTEQNRLEEQVKALREENKDLTMRLMQSEEQLTAERAAARWNKALMLKSRATIQSLRDAMKQQEEQLKEAEARGERHTVQMAANKWLATFRASKLEKEQSLSHQCPEEHKGELGMHDHSHCRTAEEIEAAKEAEAAGADDDDAIRRMTDELEALDAKLQAAEAQRDAAESMTKALSHSMNKATMEKRGFLLKKSDGRLYKRWKKRYVVVKTGFLLVYEDEKDVGLAVRPKDAISIMNSQVITGTKGDGQLSGAKAKADPSEDQVGKMFRVRVQLPKAGLVDLAMESEEEMGAWATAIAQCSCV